jgi:DNA polymerase-4
VLVREFGKYGEEIHMLANGHDPSPVDSESYAENKSISRSTTLREDATDIEYLKDILLELSEEVGLEARRQDYSGKTVSIVIKYSDFQTITRQKAMPQAYLTKEIYETGVKLLEDNWNRTRPIRLIGIGIGGTSEEKVQQISLFDLTEEKVDTRKEEKLEKTLDAIKERYGVGAVKRARLITTEKEHKS